MYNILVLWHGKKSQSHLRNIYQNASSYTSILRKMKTDKILELPNEFTNDERKRDDALNRNTFQYKHINESEAKGRGRGR